MEQNHPPGSGAEKSSKSTPRGARAARVEPVPNFFIVGAPKCATTSMDYYLGQHPEIYMCPSKEPHFFAEDLYPGAMKCSEERYRSFFEEVAGEPVVGESSVFYMLSRTAAAAIRAHQPQAKILIMLRDPIEVIESHHSQIVYERYETEKSLERALARESERRRVHDREGRVTARERVLHYRDVVRFSEQIARFLEQFPREQIHIVLYDDLRADLASIYADVLQFLGVDSGFQANFKVLNANKQLRNERLGAVLRQTPDWVTRTSRLVFPSPQLRYRTRMWLKRLNSKRTRRPPMPGHLRTEIAAELRPDVERLEALLGRDLSHWCRGQA